MKIAICFSGSIRDFPTCLPSLKRYLLDNLNADIFLHLWKMDNTSELETDVNFKWRNDSCAEDYVIDQLKPVSHVIDKYSEEWKTKIINDSCIKIDKLDAYLKSYAINACGMYYKINKCFELVEDYCGKNNTKYDIVIRARLDFIFEDHVLEKDFINFTDNKIFLIRDRYATHSKLVTNDKFFAGSFNAMKKMCDLFKYIHIYQPCLKMVEGQSLNEMHIRTSKFQATWIGHKHTYYKCMGRHRIFKNHKYIIIENNRLINDFLYELSYYLLYDGYNIIYLNKSDIVNKQIDILSKFENFSFANESIILNHAEYYIGNIYNKNLTNKQIIINYSTSDSAGNTTNNTPNNTTFIYTNKNIGTNNLVNFVVSIITTNQYGNTYCFDKELLVNEIDTNENVIYQYLDHGYYSAKILSYDKKNNKYTLQVGKVIRNCTRNDFKIIDLIKYHKRIGATIMPIN